MNKYTIDYATCMNILTKPIILADVILLAVKKGKELSYDPQTLKFSVIEYDLVPSDKPFNEGSMYYSTHLNLPYDKVIVSQDTEYDLTEAVEAYNAMELAAL